MYGTPGVAEHRGRSGPLYRCLGGAQELEGSCTELRCVLSTEGGAHPCRDSREELENGTGLRRGKPDTESWVDSRNNNRGELLRAGCPCTEPQGERGPEGGTDPCTGTWGVSLVDEGASTAILRKAGTDGGMGPCTDSWGSYRMWEVLVLIPKRGWAPRAARTPVLTIVGSLRTGRVLVPISPECLCPGWSLGRPPRWCSSGWRTWGSGGSGRGRLSPGGQSCSFCQSSGWDRGRAGWARWSSTSVPGLVWTRWTGSWKTDGRGSATQNGCSTGQGG